MTGRLLSVLDVADRVGLSEWAVRRAIHDGELPAFKPRGRLRVHTADVDAWLEGTRVVPRAGEPPVVLTRLAPGSAAGGFRERMRRGTG